MNSLPGVLSYTQKVMKKFGVADQRIPQTAQRIISRYTEENHHHPSKEEILEEAGMVFRILFLGK